MGTPRRVSLVSLILEKLHNPEAQAGVSLPALPQAVELVVPGSAGEGHLEVLKIRYYTDHPDKTGNDMESWIKQMCMGTRVSGNEGYHLGGPSMSMNVVLTEGHRKACLDSCKNLCMA